MFLACGVGAPGAALFHVATHAFFKALLFLCAGNVIHALKGEQDIRYMGGLQRSMPWTFRLMTIGALGLAGVPGLAGFFSKDEIFAAAAKQPWLLGMGFAVAFMTAGYSSRLIWRVFLGEEQQPGHDPHGWELHALWPLAAGTIAAGYFYPEARHVWWIMAVSTVLAVVGLWWGTRFEVFEPLHTLFKRRWYVDDLYRAVWLHGVGMRGSRSLGNFDANVIAAGPLGLGWAASIASVVVGWFDRFAVDGTARLTAALFQAFSYPVRLLQTGGMLQYALAVLVTLAGFLGFYLLRFGGRP
jgi:NADH-quinone oxidoreductase subunit L